jgi:hypothetical protein
MSPHNRHTYKKTQSLMIAVFLYIFLLVCDKIKILKSGNKSNEI